MSSRIGKGPWARSFGAMLVPDESTPEALRGKELWLAGVVEDLRIEPGLITASVDGCAVTLSTPSVPPRIWAAMASYARGRGALERAVNGEVQLVQLESLMTQDWNEPLVPKPAAVVRTCACPDERCEHMAALGYAVAEQIDRDPALLLRWRGCRDGHPEVPAWDDGGAAPPDAREAAWRASGALPADRPGRPLVEAAVLRRLGVSGIAVGDADLVERLLPAYAVFTTGG